MGNVYLTVRETVKLFPREPLSLGFLSRVFEPPVVAQRHLLTAWSEFCYCLLTVFVSFQPVTLGG